MKEALKNIQNGEYAKRFILEGSTNYPEMTARAASTPRTRSRWWGEAAQHDAVDRGNKLVDKSKN